MTDTYDYPAEIERDEDGRHVIPPNEISDARQRVADGLSRLPQEHRDLRQPDHFPVSISENLQSLESQIRGRLSAALTS